MPEGPEVRRMTKDLAASVSEKTLESIQVVSGRYTKKPLEGLVELNAELPTRIIGAGCHGKFMYMLTASGYNIWNTLGMSGRWTKRETKHSRICLTFSNKEKIYFDDVRNFGTLKIVYGKHMLLEKLKKLGPDLMAEDIDADFFVCRIREHNEKPITKVLMNQAVFAGIGNYVKA